jgi:hypothetical protein
MSRLGYHIDEKEILEVGLEPTALGLLDPRSNQLSYTSSCVTGCHYGKALALSSSGSLPFGGTQTVYCSYWTARRCPLAIIFLLK